MKSLAVEAKEKFKHGFILNEGELRRVVDLFHEQIKKLPNPGEFDQKYTVKFKNGAIAQTDSIDDVLQQENSGSGLIVRLRYELESLAESPLFAGAVEFINPDLDEEPGFASVKVLVRGSDRDWVFVTSSLLRERIDKIKRFAPNQLFSGKGSGRVFVRLSAMVLGVVVSLVFSGMFMSKIGDSTNTSKDFNSAIISEKIHDPIRAMIRLEEIREARIKTLELASIPFKALLVVGGFFVSLILLWAFFYRYYLIFNFCWGDYVEVFQRRERARNFWLVVIGAGMLVSFLGGVLANQLKLL